MIGPRRFLPSIRLLMAFDAVVRHGSVTAAADELNLTQSTVSRLILTLEEQLGNELFTRANRRLVPTATALVYRREIGRALEIVRRASMAVVANPQGGTLSLATLPTFATRWLGPRLGTFLSDHPGIAINLSTRIGPIDFAGEAFDAAIFYGETAPGGTNHLKLFDERVTACVSRQFAATHRLKSPEDLAGLPLLHLESRPSVWADWFAGQGGGSVRARGMLMDQFSMMIQAAITGLGIALLPDYLAQIEIAEDRLVAIFKPSVPATGAYWLVWPDEKDADIPLTAFRKWLEQQADLMQAQQA